MKRILLFFFILLPIASIAQLQERDTQRIQIQTSLSGIYQAGNVDLFILRGGLSASFWPYKQCVFKTENRALYQSFGGNKADVNIDSRNFLYLLPRQRIYPLLMSFTAHSFRRKVDFRWLNGAGITVVPVQTSKQLLKLSVSTFYEYSRFGVADFNLEIFNDSRTVKLWRFATYLNGQIQLIDQKWTIRYWGFLEPAFKDLSNFRAEIWTGLDYKVWRGLSITASYHFIYEHLVVNGIDPYDRLFLFGLTYNIKRQ